VSANIFTASPGRMLKLLQLHHIPRPPALTLCTARDALLTHLISRACVGVCSSESENPKHSCKCKRIQCQSMSFNVLSPLSDSESTFPQSHVEPIADALGLADSSRAKYPHFVHYTTSSYLLQLSRKSWSLPLSRPTYLIN
jgi:hypothetical protein